MGSLQLSPPILVLFVSVIAVSVLAWTSRRLREALVLLPFEVRRRKQVYRLLTAGWVHADLAHLAFNLLTLYFFAFELERSLGTLPLLFLYVTGVVVGFVPTTLRHMKEPGYASLGASGAVAAVMFGAVLLRPTMRIQLVFLPIPLPGFAYALGYLAYSAYRAYRSDDGVNHEAHFAGAIYGAIVTFALEPAKVEAGLRKLLG